MASKDSENETRLRVALVGCEQVGRYRQAAYRAGGLDLVYSTVSRAGIPSATLDQLVGELQHEFDAAIVETPVPERAEVVRRFGQSGKSCLVQGPIAIEPELASEVRSQFGSGDAALTLVRETDGHPYYETIRERLRLGQLGNPGLLRVHHWQPDRMALSESKWIEWLENQAAFALEVFGDRPATILAKRIGDSVGIQLHLGFATGGMMLADHTLLPGSKQTFLHVSLIGSDGAAYADDQRNTNLLLSDQSQGILVNAGDVQLATQLSRWRSAATPDDQPSDPDTPLQVALAAWESVEANRVVTWKGARYGL